MFGRILLEIRRPLLVFFVVSIVFAAQPVANASPFGQGVFGADVPFGSATSLAIALGGNVSLALAPSGQNFTANGSHTVTVTSTDVVGYNLYAYIPGSTSMTSGGATIPASSNTSAGALAVNSWGYNTDGSGNYLGMTTIPALIKTANGPFKTGDNTTVSYGVLTNITKAAGAYNVAVTYTAVARTQ
jgi:hypothetical protein